MGQMQKLLVTLLALLTATAFVSCGGEEPAENVQEEQTAEQAPADSEDAEGGDTEDAEAEEAGEAAEAADDEAAVIESDFKSIEHQGYTLEWRVDGDMLDVVLSYETTGWIAVGFDPSRMMQDANIIIGYVTNGSLNITDQYGTATTDHQLDTEIGGSNDIADASGSESNGRTELRFRIPLDSGDDADKPLTPGETYTVLLAHGPEDADDTTTYHQGRTSVEIEI